ncbi:MAG: Holliday junction branch migration protein RuvA [Candidatus Caenarcaniphilales bacterium]|nr:Holliday junction branch migration protein RuvA [Candidatus Caenarcaniphilales bacterium]
MYQYIKGTIVEKDLQNKIIILEQAGIGYQIFTNLKTMNKLSLEAEAKVFLKSVIKEEEMKLFGFADKASKEIYEILLSVSGVGPKAAMNILEALDIDDLISAVLNDKPKLISQAQGIGTKTAQRIALELNTKLNKFNQNYNKNENTDSDSYSSEEEVMNILVNLGFDEITAHKRIKLAKESGITDECELLVRFCLQENENLVTT